MADSAYSVTRAQLVAQLQANATVGSITTYGWPNKLGQGGAKEYVAVVDPPEDDPREPHSLGTSGAPGHVKDMFVLWVVVATTKKGQTAQQAVERREDLMDPVTTVLRANQSSINSTAAAAGLNWALITRVARTEVPTTEGWEAKAVVVVSCSAQI